MKAAAAITPRARARVEQRVQRVQQPRVQRAPVVQQQAPVVQQQAQQARQQVPVEQRVEQQAQRAMAAPVVLLRLLPLSATPKPRRPSLSRS
jgi:hypothetical protein